MPDHRLHRGPHPEDGRLFAAERWAMLRAATADLGWLLSREYALPSALKLVGDRYQLAARQRVAAMRSACSDEALAYRAGNRLTAGDLAGQRLVLDGYNVLTTVEAALAGAVLLRGRDSCLRDMASMHGHYKRVLETAPALGLIGRTLARLGVGQAHWLLDAPVSNSGRLAAMILQIGEQERWPFTVELVRDPDPVVARCEEAIATADSIVLDGPHWTAAERAERAAAGSAECPAAGAGPRWFNLTQEIVATHVPEARVVPLG